MRVTLDCGHTINDNYFSTVCYIGNPKRSHGDQQRSRSHYPLDHSPKGFCSSCDVRRPCPCDDAEKRLAESLAHPKVVEMQAQLNAAQSEASALRRERDLAQARVKSLEDAATKLSSALDQVWSFPGVTDHFADITSIGSVRALVHHAQEFWGRIK